MGGENSKLAFRKCVFRLADQRGISDTAEDAWSPFWLMPDSPHDVFSLVTPADIRRIRDNAEENFIKLLDKVFDRLLVLKGTRDLAKTPANTKQLLNCIRVLTRLVPFVYETRSDRSSIEDIVLWTQRPRPGSGADYMLGRQLVAAVIDLLFTSGFTVPQATVGEDAVVRYTIWENGVGQTSSLGSSKENISNRVEVLRLLLVLCSKTMYIPPAYSVAVPNRALHTISYNANKKMVLCLLCSLINTSLKYRTQGWTIPYRNSTTLDPADELSLHAMQVLFIMLDYQTPASKGGKGAASQEDSAEEANSTAPSMVLITGTDTGAQNLFRVFVAKLHRQQEFDYLISNIMRLLEEAMRSNLSILASVTKQPTRHVMPQEAIILLWLLLENNTLFKEYVVDHNRALRLFSVLLYFMLNGYTDPAQSGMVRTISHILHYLSEDGQFATRLMQPFDQSILPSTMRIVDASLTHADFMINTAFTLLSSSKPYLVPVYSNLLLLVRNVSPYLTQISQLTADKLISLFDIISSPAFIISEPYHVKWLIYLIEVFDYVVHYRAVDNPRLMYSMVKARSCFTRLRDFDLDKAKSELAALREKKSKSEATRTIGGSASQTPNAAESEDITPSLSALKLDHGAREGAASPALSDKARGKKPDPGLSPTPERHEPMQAVTSKQSASAGSGFQPSSEWVFSWLPDLPLDPIIAVLDALAAHIDQIAEQVERDAQESVGNVDGAGGEAAGSSSEQADSKQPIENADDNATTSKPSVDAAPKIIHWLSTDDMAKALPNLEESMPEIRPRLQGMSPALIVWFRSLLWSLIYASGMKPFGIWKNTQVRLFVVKK
ncbi:high-temperature-induced dauer-formation protein-domain-containing protein [Coemansia mojavensis]|nr:high-temperature-induced dauer-formation protein-domain-containing protein [Coemansia mojavensis]